MLQFHRQVACFSINNSKGDIPNGVLNAVRYAQSASSIIFDQSFLELLTVFSRMDLISRFDTSAYPFDCGVTCEGCTMSHSILLQDFVNHLIAEMSTVICNQCVDHYPIHGPARLAFKWKENVG